MPQIPFKGDAPEPHPGHVPILLVAILCLFGGASSENTVGHNYKFDIFKKHWGRTVVTGQSAAPHPRRSSHAAVGDVHSRMYFFRGFDDWGPVLNNPWILELQASLAVTGTEAGTFSVTLERTRPMDRTLAHRGGHTATLVGRWVVVFGVLHQRS